MNSVLVAVDATAPIPWQRDPLAGKSFGQTRCGDAVIHAIRSFTRPPWAARLLWSAAAVTGWLAADAALDGRSAAAGTVAAVALWGLWAVVLVALIVPSTVGLTVVRMAAPLAVVAAVVLWVCGAGAVRGGVACAVTLAFAVLVHGADLGQAFAQASAYGDEQRFPLRAPAAMLPPIVVSWLVWATLATAAVVLLAAHQWLVGTLLTLLAGGVTAVLVPRFHQLSRRWLVLVPAGVVLHDHTVLADTAMTTRPNVVAMRLAPADTEAADLTGPAAGHAVEVCLREMATVVLAPTRRTPTGTALHVQSFLVAPTRPGRLLAAAAVGRLPVG